LTDRVGSATLNSGTLTDRVGAASFTSGTFTYRFGAAMAKDAFPFLTPMFPSA
jgi:hypothetical protein